MKAVLEVIKRYVFEIVCGAAGLAGIVLIVLGMGAMDSVKSQLAERQQLKSNIDQLARKPKPINEKSIEMENRRIERINEDYARVIKFAEKINAYEPLIEGAFPRPTIEQKKAFQGAYRAQVGVWLNELNAKQPPNQDDFDVQREQIKADMKARGELPEEKEGATRGQSQELEELARVQASIKRAHEASIYASEYSFQDSPISSVNGPMDQNVPPGDEQMWNAQLEVWVQRSVVDAIARVNDEAAKKLTEAGKKAWVGVLPIKELVSLQVGQYYLIDGEEAKNTTGVRGDDQGGRGGRGGRGGSPADKTDRAFPPLDATKVFTQNQSTDLYELVQFSVRLVVDSRDIPTVIAGLCQDSFHTPLSVSYESIEPNTSMTGKIYGDEPVVEMTIDFETVFFSELYLDIMPDKILEVVKKQRPQEQEQGT